MYKHSDETGGLKHSRSVIWTLFTLKKKKSRFAFHLSISIYNIYLDKNFSELLNSTRSPSRAFSSAGQVEREARAGGGAQTAPPWPPPSHNQLREMSEPRRRRWPLQTGGWPGNSNTWITDLCSVFFGGNRRYNGEYYKWHVLPHWSRDALQPIFGASWKSARADEGSKKKNDETFFWGTWTFIICVPKRFNPCSCWLIRVIFSV